MGKERQSQASLETGAAEGPAGSMAQHHCPSACGNPNCSGRQAGLYRLGPQPCNAVRPILIGPRGQLTTPTPGPADNHPQPSTAALRMLQEDVAHLAC